MAERLNVFRRIVINTAWLGGAESFGRLLSLAAVIHLSRVLLPAGMGFVDFGIAAFGLSQTLVLGGVETLAARRAARSGRGLDRLAGTTLLVSWLYAVLVLGLVGAIAWLSPDSTLMPTAALLFAFAAALRPLGMRFAFWGREELRTVALGNVASHVAFLGLCLSFVEGPADLMKVPAIWFGKELTRAALPFAVFVRRYGRPRFTTRPSRLRPWLAASLPMALARLARGALLSIDIVVLGLLAAPAAVGLYGAAFRIPGFLSALAMMFHTSSFPAVARAIATGKASRLRLIHLEMAYAVLGFGVPVVAVISVISEPLMVAIFGSAFVESAPLLEILIWKAVLLAVGGLYRNVAIADRPSVDVRVTVMGISVAVVAMLSLIPVLGPTGAAIGTLLGEATLLVGYAHLAGGRVGLVPRLEVAWLARLAVGLGLIYLGASVVPPDPPGLRIAALLGCGAIAVLLVNFPLAGRLWRCARH